MVKKIIIIAVSLIIIFFIAYNYLYQEHRNIEKEEVAYVMSSQDFFNEFSLKPVGSAKLYLDKTVLIDGNISEINEYDITLDDAVLCQFGDKIIFKNKVNDRLKIKGRCIGYDDLLEQVRLDQCVLID